MLEHAYVTTATKVDVVRNAYGNYERVSANDVNYKCRFRQRSEESRNSQMELVVADAVGWFAPSLVVAEGDLFSIEDRYYKVIFVAKAKKLGSTVVEFLKVGFQINLPAIS